MRGGRGVHFPFLGQRRILQEWHQMLMQLHGSQGARKGHNSGKTLCLANKIVSGYYPIVQLSSGVKLVNCVLNGAQSRKYDPADLYIL